MRVPFSSNKIFRMSLHLVPVRRVARLIIVDARNSVLLLRYDEYRANRPGAFWATPGGALEAGERPRDAAVKKQHHYHHASHHQSEALPSYVDFAVKQNSKRGESLDFWPRIEPQPLISLYIASIYIPAPLPNRTRTRQARQPTVQRAICVTRALNHRYPRKLFRLEPEMLAAPRSECR